MAPGGPPSAATRESSWRWRSAFVGAAAAAGAAAAVRTARAATSAARLGLMRLRIWDRRARRKRSRAVEGAIRRLHRVYARHRLAFHETGDDSSTRHLARGCGRPGHVFRGTGIGEAVRGDASEPRHW